MRLKLQQLKKVVSRVRTEEKTVQALRSEVSRVLGPIMDTGVRLESLAEQVNDRVSVMNRTGRTAHLGFQPSVVVPFMNHSSPEVRSMAANLVPVHQLEKMRSDPHSMVRSIVAQRAELTVVREMMKSFPRDEGLRSIYQVRTAKARLLEAGLPNAKPDDEPFDLNGEGRLGDAVKQPPGPELSDEWYREQAHRLFLMYDKNLEVNWEEKAVNNLVNHSKATNGVEIDGEKLLQAVKDYLEEREDEALERNALKELAASLSDEVLEEGTFYTDDSDPVRDLVESGLTGTAYIQQANRLFKVREARIPAGLKKYRIGEHAINADQGVPAKAELPRHGAPRALDEQALDLYVRYWNEHQSLVGEPFRISWTSHPSEPHIVGFTSVLR